MDRPSAETPRVIERPRTIDLAWAAVALFVVALFAAGLVVVQGRFPASRENVRVDRLERLGYEATIAQRGVPTADNGLAFTSTRSRPAHGEWALDSYEIDRLLASATSCDISAYVLGPSPRGLSRTARIDVALGGVPLWSLSFGRPTIEFASSGSRRAPAGIQPAEVYFTPINRTFGLRFEMGPNYCHTIKRWNVDVTMRDVAWNIQRVGVIVRFVPPRLDPARATLAIVVAAFVLAGLALSLHVLLAIVCRTYGLTAIIVIVTVVCIATLTHDEWDYAVWLRFIDLVAFGGGDPAYMWAGSPLWPFVPTALFSPVLTAFYALTNNASDELPSICLKLAMAIALSANAYLISSAAPAKLRRFIFFTTLLAPVGLYEVTGGYREVFAATFVLAGLAFGMRSRYVAAAVAMALGTSISESLAPLLLFPAAIAFVDRRAGRNSALSALTCALTALGLLAFEWFALIPHTFATNAVVTRVQAYRYGGASLFAVLDYYKLLPQWVGLHSLALVAIIFVVLAIPITAMILRTMARPADDGYALRAELLRYFIALVVALFIAYRGIDPNDWYPLFAVMAYYVACFDPRSPYALVVGVLSGFAFYTIAGISDFVNWSYFLPRDQGLLGTLTARTYVAIAIVNLTLLSFYVAAFSRRSRSLFSRGTPFYAALFVAAAATAASQFYVPDAVFCAAAVVGIGIAFMRIFRLSRRAMTTDTALPLRLAGFAVVVLASTLAQSVGAGGAPASLAAFAAIAWGTRAGFGLCDLGLIAGSIWIVCNPNQFGWVSITGWTVLSILTLSALMSLSTNSNSGRMTTLGKV